MIETLPEKVEFPNGDVFDVKIVSTERLVELGGRAETLGFLSYTEKVIYISDNPYEDFVRVFWHEMAHWFLVHYDIENNEQLAQVLADFIMKINKQMPPKVQVDDED